MVFGKKNKEKNLRIKELEQTISEMATALHKAHTEISSLKNNSPTASPKSSEGVDEILSEINCILSLCHPDKHGNSERSTRITQKLIHLKKSVRRRSG